MTHHLPVRTLLALVLALAASAAALAQDLPDPVPLASHVLDDVGVLSESDRQDLDARLAALDDSTSVQLAVLTADIEGTPIADLAREVFDAVRFGRAGVNNGLLVLLALDDREVYVSVGTGLEWQIPDSVAAAIVAQMAPLFREGDYARGLRVGVEALAERAGSVPWSVRYGSASEAVAAGGGALSEVARVRGSYAGGVLETDTGPVRLSFPPHWEGVYPRPGDGDRLDLLGRVVGTAPLAVQVLGLAPSPRSP